MPFVLRIFQAVTFNLLHGGLPLRPSIRSVRIWSMASSSLILLMAKPTWMSTQSPFTGKSSCKSPRSTLRRTPTTSMSAARRSSWSGKKLDDLYRVWLSTWRLHSFFRARILNENFSSSFTFIAPPATEASFRS